MPCYVLFAGMRIKPETSIPHTKRPKGPERAVPASHQLLTYMYQGTGTGASLRASPRTIPASRGKLCPEQASAQKCANRMHVLHAFLLSHLPPRAIEPHLIQFILFFKHDYLFRKKTCSMICRAIVDKGCIVAQSVTSKPENPGVTCNPSINI